MIVHLDLERSWRGGQRQVALLIEALAGAGREQRLVARERSELARRVSDRGLLPVHQVKTHWQAWLVLNRLSKPRILHAHSGNTVPLAVLARRKEDCSLATRRLDLPVNAFWYRRLDRVVAISASVKRSLIASGLKPSQVIRIPSAIDTRRSLDPQDRDRLRSALHLPPDALLGLTVGALVPQKDPLTLVRALRELPEAFHHLWIGDGPLRDEVSDLARRLDVAGRLHLAGFQEDPDPWFAAADLFVLPSIHEGLGTVLLDAFHFGLPVAATSIPGTQELLEDGVSACLVPPGEAVGLARVICKLTGDRSLCEKLVVEGRRRVAGFSIDLSAAAYMDLYDQLFDIPAAR